MAARAGEDDAPGENDEPIPPRRIEYPGDNQDRGSARHDPATATHTPAPPAPLNTGAPAAHPADAHDTPAIAHPADHKT